jgi:hypothetical protein
MPGHSIPRLDSLKFYRQVDVLTELCLNIKTVLSSFKIVPY